MTKRLTLPFRHYQNMQFQDQKII